MNNAIQIVRLSFIVTKNFNGEKFLWAFSFFFLLDKRMTGGFSQS